MRRVSFVLAFVWSLSFEASGLRAEPANQLPEALRGVGFDQRLDGQVPLDLEFRDEAGRSVRLGQYFGERPVILVLAYYECPMLCTQVLNGLVRGLLEIPFEPPRDFQVVVVSFDPHDTPQRAADKKRTYLTRYGHPGAEAGWHFLTGSSESIRKLTEAVGFRYRWDQRSAQYVHASGLVVLTPGCRISRYFYDISFPGRDLRLGLVEASQGKIGSPVEQILLFCFHYDATLGKYGPAVMRFVRIGGVATVVGMAVLMGLLWRSDRAACQKARPQSPRVALEGET